MLTIKYINHKVLMNFEHLNTIQILIILVFEPYLNVQNLLIINIIINFEHLNTVQILIILVFELYLNVQNLLILCDSYI